MVKNAKSTTKLILSTKLTPASLVPPQQSLLKQRTFVRNKDGEVVQNYLELNDGSDADSYYSRDRRIKPSESKPTRQEESLITRNNLERLLTEKYKKFDLVHDNFNDNMAVLSNALEDYLKNFLEDLVKTSRIRNSNLNLLANAATSDGVPN